MMSEEAIKRRIADAKESAKEKYRGLNFNITNSDNEVFCFIATSKAGIYEAKVRVVVDKISEEDVCIVKKMRILPNQTKAILCRPYKSRKWKTLEFDHLNNICQ